MYPKSKTPARSIRVAVKNRGEETSRAILQRGKTLDQRANIKMIVKTPITWLIVSRGLTKGQGIEKSPAIASLTHILFYYNIEMTRFNMITLELSEYWKMGVSIEKGNRRHTSAWNVDTSSVLIGKCIVLEVCAILDVATSMIQIIGSALYLFDNGNTQLVIGLCSTIMPIVISIWIIFKMSQPRVVAPQHPPGG